MRWEIVKLGELISESRVPSDNPDPDRRITVRLNVLGVEKRPLENEKAGATKQFIRKSGQFIYGKQNFHKGAFGIIPKELDGFESSADLPSFDVREDCLPEWIYHFFKQGGYYLELAKIARGVATQRIHPEQIYDLGIPLPNLETQKSIINSIKVIEGKGERLNKEYSHQLTLLDSLNQAILQEAVQGKLLPQDPADEPASELLKRIKAEKAVTLSMSRGGKKEKPSPPIKPEEIPFEIPENWVWCRLGEITNYGSSPKAEPTDLKKDTWVLDLEDIEKTTSNLLCKIRFNERSSLSTKSVFKTGDVLYSKLRPYLDKVIVADEDGVCTTEILPLKCFADLNPFYLKYALKRADFLKYVNSKTKGMKMPRLGTKEGEMALIPLPPLSEQKRIVAEIEKQLANTKQLKEHIIANQQATEQLLKALLHGEFEVGGVHADG